MAKISVIVPVYNVEKYIRKCLDSLINQSLKDLEIIIVNDGSTDNSQKIINEYVKKYKNIRSFENCNSGPSLSRNCGIMHSTGDYIAFVDSDDYIDKKMFETMYNKAIEFDFDVVVCNLFLATCNGDIIKSVQCGIKHDIYNEDVKKNMINIYPSVWNKIYKRELLMNNKIFFKDGVWFEDVELIYRLFPYIKSLGYVNEKLYYYVQRDGTITKTFDKRLYNYIDNWNGLLLFYKKNKFYNNYKKELEYCYVRYLYATFIKQATNYSVKKDYDDAVSCAIKNVKNNFPHYRRNSYFYNSLKGLYLVFFNKVLANIYYKKCNK